MEKRKINYLDEEVVLEATVVCQAGVQKRPIIFIFHAWEGKDAFAEQKAEELAQLGYVGCALDLYGKGILGKSKEECSALMHPLFSDRAKLKKRIQASQTLFASIPEADPAKVGAIGFCFGGLCALDFARSGADVKGVVSFHGLLQGSDVFDHAKMLPKVLVFHGYQDPMVKPESLLSFSQEMETKKVDFQLHVFGQAMHAFTNPKANDPTFGTLYDKVSDERSWLGMQSFFQELFGKEM